MIELWNSSDCAEFFRCSRRHFMERMKPLPDFPKASYLPTLGDGKSRPLWHPHEVRAWAAANLTRGKHAAPASQAA